MTAPDAAGIPGSRSTPQTAGQAPWQVARDAFWEAERGALARSGDGWDWATVQDGRRGWEAAVAAIAAAAPAPAAEGGPHYSTADTECADCALRAAILAEVEAAADTAASGEDPECEMHADAILDLIHAARQPQAAPELAARLRAAITAHEPSHGATQWYVDEHSIDCDAEEFWSVIAAALDQP